MGGANAGDRARWVRNILSRPNPPSPWEFEVRPMPSHVKLKADRSPHTEPVGAALWSRPGFLVRRLHQIHAAMFAEECGAFNITPIQYGLMTILLEQPGLEPDFPGQRIGHRPHQRRRCSGAPRGSRIGAAPSKPRRPPHEAGFPHGRGRDPDAPNGIPHRSARRNASLRPSAKATAPSFSNSWAAWSTPTTNGAGPRCAWTEGPAGVGFGPI